MDFWDLTKVLLRRWYLTVPFLLLTAYAAYWTGSTIQPDYVATSYVQVVPPTAPEEPQTGVPKKNPGPINPWLSLGYNALGQAAVLTVQDTTVLEQLKAQGLSDTVLITLDDQSPVVTIEAIGTTKEQAAATTEEVVKRLDVSVRELQAEYGAKKTSYATTRRLDQGTNIVEKNSKVKRALVAVLGAGVLASTAVTIGVDALLRRRSRLKAARAADDAGTTPTSGPPAGTAVVPVSPAPVPASAPAPAPRPAGREYASSALDDEPGDRTVQIRPAQKSSPLRIPGEATIVLPTPGSRPSESGAGHNGKDPRP
ncbi:hypothetical protein [Actinoplanes sp. M2I2]|uniref:hypothetical protein n=1 Tax=Actinoplanes sp. M2I2 TaxID=1734444 RepID=UPI00202199CC|nr:hypothetical protein [Actinoplanes sp. M2I2]